MNTFEKYNLCENEIYAFFASTSENVALVLYFKKIIEFKRTAKHCKYFFFVAKLEEVTPPFPLKWGWKEGSLNYIWIFQPSKFMIYLLK